ncbi:MAG: hypothetical protein E3J75_01950 [Dehalococcoidia bacterium]|nr:MAG: hypothetical protein E3J75_01950 [Dehalococcoidia bacterium]
MGKVAISADSVSLTPEKAREYGFTMIPLPIIMGGKQYLDTEINMDELYARLDTKENLPKTSTANVEEFLRFFAELSQKAEAIFHICMSSVFSPQYNNALKAKELAGEKLPGTRIEVADSRTIGIGVHFLFYYDKGGRVFEARTWAEAESASSFRSIVEVDASTGGTVKPVARAKTVAQIMDKLVEITKERANGNKLCAVIGHTRVPDRAEKLNGKGLIDYTFSTRA